MNINLMGSKDTFAVVAIKNTQYKVSEGDEILVDKTEGQKGDKLDFDSVLLKASDKKVEIGSPTLAKSLVKAEIVEQTKAPKVTTSVYKAKSRYRKKTGDRKKLTKIKITKIV